MFCHLSAFYSPDFAITIVAGLPTSMEKAIKQILNSPTEKMPLFNYLKHKVMGWIPGVALEADCL